MQRWNLPDGWVISARPAHPALISEDGFVAAQDRLPYDEPPDFFYPIRESLGAWARGEGVRVVGYVPRLESALMSSTVFVAPHRFAAGVQNKVIQALASGTPVVTTPVVRLGLEPIPDGILRVADTPEGLAAHVVALIRDPSLARAEGDRGQAWARDRFTWNEALEALEYSSDAGDAAPAAERLVAVGV
jgi:glycosyltransferase involved in cell wall biosynthesis